MPANLSKSKILSGLQCAKRLWLEVHRPQLKVTPESLQHLFDIGHEVNDAARALHEDGRLVEWDSAGESAIAQTVRLLEEHPDRPVFEGTFVHEGVLVRVDILKQGERGYRLIEVKAGTSVKEPNQADCAVQAWALEGCGLELDKVELAHIDNQFIYGGDGDYRGLFHHEDLADDIADLKKEVPAWVKKFREVVAGEEPDIATGDHCNTPYDCPFIAYCSGPGAEYPVSCLPHSGETAKALEAEGMADIRDIPPGRLQNETQEWVRRVTVSGRPQLKPAVKKIIRACPWPRYYLDFETIAFAVPVWKDTSPYKPLPFQWSCHVETAPGEVTHKEFLDKTGDAPMGSFAESLLDALGKTGAIFVYHSFEQSRLEELAARFPDLADDIEGVIARLVDLLPLTRQHYYHPDMRGSWSLKAVLPTIAPHLDYADLGEVRDGSAAGAAYREMIHPATGRKRAQALAADLRVYCKRDTEALIVLARFLETGKIQQYRPE